MDSTAIMSLDLICRLYSDNLFSSDVRPSDQSGIFAKELKQDEKHIQFVVKNHSENKRFLWYIVTYQVYTKQFEPALKNLDKAADLMAQWVHPILYADIYFRQDNYEKAREQIAELIQSQIDEGYLKPELKEKQTNSAYGSRLVTHKKYDKAVEFYQGIPGYETEKSILYNLGCVYTLKGDQDKAFETLLKAAENGWDSYEHLSQDPDLTVLHEDERWEKLIARVRDVWDKGADTRRSEYAKSKFNRPAPGWELKDTDGKSVKLSDYKGKLVILDFWATWCGPCMMAMPVIDEWCKTKKPENVHVFSINIWERNKEKAKKLFQDKKFAMKLIEGTFEIAEDYKIAGIPYICIIDKIRIVYFTFICIC